jgi:hypothetical protein
MAKNVDLSKLLAEGPRECWIALNSDQSEVVGRGETVQEAEDEARKRGVSDPILLWAPKSWQLAVY